MRGKDVHLENVEMKFGDFTAVHETTLNIQAGEFFSVLGPSGCGKTTILRMVSGFIQPTKGRVLIGSDDMSGLGPNKRPTALIFQNLALFPLMTNWENVAFGLEARGIPKDVRRNRAHELLSLVGLEGQETKKPTELSGGQRQRVAIARALAVEPAVLLLDEPLSALDLKLRQHMRSELKAIQRKTGVTFIFITHDQGEALAMSDRIAVMKRGIVEQVGTTDEVYDNPGTPFVATFVGENNVFSGSVSQIDPHFAVIETSQGPFRGRVRGNMSIGDEAMLFVRPERTTIVNGVRPDNIVDAHFQRRDLEGAFVNLHFQLDNQSLIIHEANLSSRSGLEGIQQIGFNASDAIVMPAGEVNQDA